MSLRPRRLGAGVSGSLICVALGGSAAGAESRILAQAQVDVDGDGRAEEVKVGADGHVTVHRTGTPSAAGAAELGPLRTARVESQPGDKGLTYLLVRGESPAGQAVLLVASLGAGGWQVAHAGPVGPLGRDAERSLAVEVGAEVLRYQTSPGITRCDGDARLFAERWAPGRGWQRLAPAAPATGARLRATATAPAGLSARALPIYRWVAASAQVGAEGRADRLAPPRELEDGDPATAWRVPAGESGAWATARATGPRSIQALRLLPAKGLRPPRGVALVFAGEKAVQVELGPGEGAQWVVLPTPVKSGCVSLVLLDGGGRGGGGGAGGGGAGGEVGLAEVAVYSDLEGRGAAGLAQRAAGVEAAPGAEAAATLLALATVDPAGVSAALSGALPGASEPGRRRLLGVAVQVARARPTPAAAALLGQLLGSVAAADRELLWQALTDLGAVGAAALAGILRDMSQEPAVRGEAARRLARQPGAVGLLLEALHAVNGHPPADRGLRRGLVEALAQVLRCQSPESEGVTRTTAALRGLFPAAAPSSGTAADTPAIAAMALDEAADLAQALLAGARGCPDARLAESVTGSVLLAWSALSGPDPFLLRYRVLGGLAQLGHDSTAGAALLDKVLRTEEDPVLRREAARAAAALRTPAYGALARRGLADRDTGVRLQALAALAGRTEGPTVIAIEQALAGDLWPQVRRAAAEALTAGCGAGTAEATTASSEQTLRHLPGPAQPDQARRPPSGPARPAQQALRRALRDPDPEVQRLALLGVARCEGAGAVPLLAKVARDEQEATPLRGQACALLAQVQGSAAAPLLVQVLRGVLADPEADERLGALAVTCTRALGTTGDPRAVPALLAAAGVPQLPALRLQAVEGVSRLCQAGVNDPRLGEALALSQKDPDGRVRAAALVASRRCRTR